MVFASASLLFAASTGPKTFAPVVYQTYAALALMALLLGAVVLRANPRRGLNQCAGALIATVGVWQFFSAMIYATPHTTAFYIRAAVSTFGLGLPVTFMLLGALRQPGAQFAELARQARWGWGFGAVFVGLAVGPWFIPYHSTAENPAVGPLWFPLGVVQALGGGYCFVSAVRHANSLQGAQRFVAQMIVGGGALMLMYFGIVQMARALWQLQPLPLASAAVASLFVGIFAYAILTKRIGRARLVFVSWAAWFAAMAAAFSVHLLIIEAGERLGASSLAAEALALSGAMIVWASLMRWRRWMMEARVVTSAADLKLRLAARLGKVKGALDLDAAVSELVDWSGAQSGLGFVRERAQWRCGNVRLAVDDALICYLEKHRWVTTEGLNRSWQSDETQAIGSSLARLGGALAVMTKPGALGPGVVVVLSERGDRSHFSHVEIDALLMITDSLGALVVSSEAGRKAFAIGRMQALELMGASIGHDFKQHLTAVKLIAQRLLVSPHDPALVERSVPVLLSEADKLGEFARRLMRLGAQDDQAWETFDADQLVCEVFGFVKPRARDARVELQQRLVGKLLPLRGDRARLLQALVNLCVNGIEAMAALERDKPRLLTVEISLKGSDWQIVVADTGPGLPERIKGRVFDPFVSEGKPGGDGLGLYLVWDTVTKAGGAVWHEPNEPQGTRFVMTLPA